MGTHGTTKNQFNLSFGNTVDIKPKMVKCYVIFAGKLVEQRKYSDAATVLEQYAQVNSPLTSKDFLVVPHGL